MEVYLDNSATTRPYDEVVEAVCNTMTNVYGNPSSLHKMGKTAEDLLNKSREIVASTIYCTPNELYFTSGGTESDNLAIIGYCMCNKKKGNKIITQATEHKAVLESFAYLETQGFEVSYIEVDEKGFIDIEELKRKIDDKTILVSVMAVNNETGAIMPIDEISSLIPRDRCVFHVDAVQAYGKIKINVKKQNIDMLTISAHKIHGPNGVGALYIKKGLRVNPIIKGGQQERGIRSGTENLAGIVGFSRACEIKFSDMDKTNEYVLSLKNRLIEGIKAIDKMVVNSPENSVPYVLNVSFEGIRSEVLLHILESKGIYISTGSACNSKKNSYSYVLKSMGLRDKVVDGAVRFSFSQFNTIEEIDYVCDILNKEVPALMKIMAR